MDRRLDLIGAAGSPAPPPAPGPPAPPAPPPPLPPPPPPPPPVPEIHPEVNIEGLDPTNPVVWGRAPSYEACYSVPASRNDNPKALVFFVGDGSGGYYSNGLRNAGYDNPLPNADSGCVDISFNPGVPDGAYTVKLMEGNTELASTHIYQANAYVGFGGLGYNSQMLILGIQWQVGAASATTTDMIQVKNSRGDVVYWFYTSCSCQTAPGAAAVPSGMLQFTLHRAAGQELGGYDIGFFPGGGSFEAASADNWINWGAIGW